MMRTRTKALLLVIVGGSLLALLFLWLTHLTTEPTYQDRTLSEWLAAHRRMYSRRNFVSPAESNNVVRAIRAIGTNGIPIVLEWMKYDPNTALGPRLRKMVDRLPLGSGQTRPLTEMLSDGERRSNQTYDFWGCLGSEASPAIPALTDMAYATNHTTSAQHAILALGLIGTNAYPVLARMLGDTHFSYRNWVPSSMGRVHAQDIADWSMALPLILHTINDPDTNLSASCVSALGLFHIDPNTCIPLLTNKLASTDPNMQRAAIYALRGFGQQATSAVPFLTLMLTNSERQLRFYATNALKQIDPDALMQ